MCDVYTINIYRKNINDLSLFIHTNIIRFRKLDKYIIHNWIIHKKRAVINYHASLRDSSHPERQKNGIHTGAKVFLNFCHFFFHKMFCKPTLDWSTVLVWSFVMIFWSKMLVTCSQYSSQHYFKICKTKNYPSVKLCSDIWNFQSLWISWITHFKIYKYLVCFSFSCVTFESYQFSKIICAVFSRKIDWCYKLIARIWRENRLRAQLCNRKRKT